MSLQLQPGSYLFVLTGNVAEDSLLVTGEHQQQFMLETNFVTMTNKCYTELFDTKDLIMLSPDAPLLMESYEPDKVYVVGGKI